MRVGIITRLRAVVEIIVFLAICCGAYLYWKNNVKQKKDQRYARIESEVHSTVLSIMHLLHSQAEDKDFQEQMTKILLMLIRNIETIRGEDSILVGSIAHNYLLAVTSAGESYIEKINYYIGKGIGQSKSQDESIAVILSFLLNRPEPEFIYIPEDREVSTSQYSPQFRAEMDSLFKKR